MADSRPLVGRTVVTTRERAGRLDELLGGLGAEVLHVPLIVTIDPTDGGAALRAALESLDRFDWVVVSSPAGAERVGPSLRTSSCRIGVVGTRTADVMSAHCGRPPDVVPARQTGADLAAAMPRSTGAERLLLAQADRADRSLADALRARGYDVASVVAYRTVLQRPSDAQRAEMLAGDAVAFASGSAVEAWFEAVGVETPPVAVAIGPTTADAAARFGVKVSIVATDHSIEGLAAAILRALSDDP